MAVKEALIVIAVACLIGFSGGFAWGLTLGFGFCQ